MSAAESWDLLQPRLTKYIPNIPTVRQHVGLLYDGDELLFGGAAGGGKSDLLCMAALQYADCPDYSAILFRRTFPMLKQPGGLLPRLDDWLHDTDATGAATIDGYPTRWDFPSGAVLTVGHLQLERDKLNYQGGEYDFVGFDELTQYALSQYVYLFSRLRHSASSKIPGRMRAGTNPGGPGHDWVKRRFAIPDEFEDGFHVVPYVDSEGNARERVFLPSHISDNPHIDQADYRRKLASMEDPVTRERLLRGDWAVTEGGGFFKREWFDIVPEKPTDITNWVRAWDLAGTEESKSNTDPDWTAGALVGSKIWGGQRHWWIADCEHFRKEPGPTRKMVKQRSQLDGPGVKVHFPQDPGQAGKDQVDSLRKFFSGIAAISSHPVTGNKAVRAAMYATSAEAGCVHLVNGPWVEGFIKEHEQFTGAKNAGHDDRVDAAADGYQQTNQIGWDGLNDDIEEEAA